MAKKSEKAEKEGGLWLPNHIRNISTLGYAEKELLADIYSFGDKGFYKSNETIAKEYRTSERTVSRWIANIIKGGFVYVKNPKGYYRTFWAKSHPDIKTAAKLWHRSKKIPKTDCKPVRQFYLTGVDKNSEVSRTNPVSRLGQKCLPTNKETYKETKKVASAADLPLPAGGQASQLLEDRKAEQQASIQRFKNGFGRQRGRKKPKLPLAELEQNRQKQIRALLADKKK